MKPTDLTDITANQRSASDSERAKSLDCVCLGKLIFAPVNNANSLPIEYDLRVGEVTKWPSTKSYNNNNNNS